MNVKKKINWSGLMQGDLVIWMVFILLLMISVVEVSTEMSAVVSVEMSMGQVKSRLVLLLHILIFPEQVYL